MKTDGFQKQTWKIKIEDIMDKEQPEAQEKEGEGEKEKEKEKRRVC